MDSRDGTGVRLEVKNIYDSSNGLLKSGCYQPPTILEPGEDAFFLSDHAAKLRLVLNIQVFRGPAGWVVSPPPFLVKDVTVIQGEVGPSIPAGETFVFVDNGMSKYNMNVTFALEEEAEMNQGAIKVRHHILDKAPDGWSL